MATRTEPNTDPSLRFLRQQPLSTSMPSNDPAWYQRLWRWGTSTTVAPINWGGAAAIEGASTRIAEIFENNEGQIVSRIQGTVNQALLRQAPPAFAAARTAIARFLASPHSAHLAEVRTQLALVDPDQHASVYQEISAEGQDRIRTLLLTLQAMYPTTQHPVVVDGASDQYALLEVSEPVRAHLNDGLSILAFTIMRHNGSLVSALEFLSAAVLDEESGLVQRGIDSLRHKLTEEGGLLDELRGSLVTRSDSVLSQAVQMLRSELTSTPHETVKQSRIALILLNQALQQGAEREMLAPLMQNAVRLLENLDRDKEAIFRARSLISEEQWRTLQAYREHLQEFIRNESSPLVHAEIQRVGQPAFQCVDNAFKGQTGVVGELIRAGDHLADRIERLLERLEHLPQRMVSNTFSQGPVTNTEPTTGPLTEEITAPLTGEASTPPITSSEAQDGSISYNTVLERSSSVLSQIMGTAGQAVSQRAASSLATMMVFIFDKIKGHLERNREHQHIIETIDPLIERVNAARENGSWSELVGTLQECKRVMQQQQVYLQGFRLPLNSVRSSPSAIPSFLTNISNHEAALNPSRAPIAHSVSREMILEESLKLKLRASAYGPIKLINEYLLQFEPDDALYASLIAIPPDTPLDSLSEIYQTRYYEWLDRSDCSLVSKWMAKMVFFIAGHVFNFFSDALISNSVAAFQRWQDAPKDSLNPKEIHIIKQLRNWLAILSASYNEAAETPTGQARDFQQMLELAIQSPQRNGGLQPAELYKSFSATVLDAYGPRFNWRNAITKYYNVQIPSTSSLYFLNPFLTVLNIFCTWTINALLFIPEWIANSALSLGMQLFLKNSPLLERNLSRTMDALKTNTRTSYALNQAIHRQLQRIWQSIQVNTSSQDEGIDLQTQDSISKKMEISRLVEYLFEVLNKSRYGTQDRMRAYLEGRLSVRDRAEREIDELFLPEALETAASMISLCFEAGLTEEAQNEFLYDILAIANGAMDSEEPVSEEECAAIEQAIREQTDQILEASIFYALEEKFDFAGEKQKAGVSQFVQELKNQSDSIAQRLRFNRALVNPFAPLSQNTLALLRSSIDDSVNFQRGRLEALSRSDGNRHFHTETKQKLNETSQQLATHFTPITDHLNHSLRIYEETMQTEQGNQLLGEMDQALTQIQSIFARQGIQTAQINQAVQYSESVQSGLGRFRSLSHIFSNQQQLNPHWNQLQTALSQAQAARHHVDILMQTIPLFERILIAKTQSLSSQELSAEARQNERVLATLIQTLPASFPHRNLLDQVLNLMHATTPEAIRNANYEYHQNLGVMIRQAGHSLQVSKDLGWLAAEQLKAKGAQYRQYAAEHIAQNQVGLQSRLNQLNQGLDTFQEWVEEVHDIPIWNFFVFDMQWATEITKDLAFGRAKQKVQELTGALYQRHNYIGIVHQMVFLPVLQHHGPQYLNLSQ
ncbi:MAG: hypothetical protein JSR39_03685 [Verrucomicrobia bacterium]|nr:hypothetical protein [Verrucomicrobiota bacterium]